MKIAQVNVYFQPFMVGGAEWYVYNMSRELVRRGHEVHVYTAETYEGHRVQRFLYKGVAPVTKKYQGTVWPTTK